jgi:hypothetical protein
VSVSESSPHLQLFSFIIFFYCSGKVVGVETAKEMVLPPHTCVCLEKLALIFGSITKEILLLH